jgi:hypothetical protein
MSMAAACVNKDLGDLLWAGKTEGLETETKEASVHPQEKQKGFEPKLLSGKTSRETRLLKTKRGKQKTDFNSRKGKTLRLGLREGERDRARIQT